MPGLSYNGYLGLGKETTFASGATVDKYVPLLSENVGLEKDKAVPDEMRGRRDRTTMKDTVETIGGDIEFQPSYENGIGEFLNAGLGNLSTNNPSGEVYEHEFTGGDNLDSYTLEIGKANVMYSNVLGAKVDSLEFSVSGGELMNVTASVIAKERESTSSSTPSYSALDPIAFHEGTVNIDGTDRSADVEAWDISIENNLKDSIIGLGDKTRSKIDEGYRDLTGSMDLYFEDDSDYNDFLNSSELSLTLTFEGKQIEGDHNYQLKFELPRVEYSSSEIDQSGSDRIVNNVEYRALYSEPSGYAIKTKLVNTVSEY